jgi:hypothetical protein
MGLTKRKHLRKRITRNNRKKGGSSFEAQSFTNEESLKELEKFSKGKSPDSEKALNLLDGTTNFWDDFWEWFKNLFAGSESTKYQTHGGALRKFIKYKSYKKR